jgi:multiple sugar transport system permease protein
MKSKQITRLSQNVLLLLIGIIFTLPAIWMLLASFDPQASQAIKIPAHASIVNYLDILTNKPIMRGFFMSFVIAGGQTAIVMVVSLMAAYPLSRFNLKRAQTITFSLLFLTAIPMTAVMVPVYQLFILMGLVDSVFGTILFMTTIGLPYGIWMSKNFFDTVSIDLEEAAWIDGASNFQALRLVVFPLMKPGIFTVIIYTFVRSWGNFFIPFVLLQTANKLPAAVKIYRFFGDRGEVFFGPLCAYSVLYMMPAVLLYSFAQNYMSKGFSMEGAAKG